MPRRPSTPRSSCPISIALEMLGDPWTLLIVRDLTFKGRHTFQEFMEGGEGIASNILADRLGRLEERGIVTRHRDPGDARRIVYHLTQKGIDLAPALVDLVVWSARYEETGAPPREVRAMRLQRDAVLADVRRRWRALRDAAGSPLAPRARR